MKEIRTYMSFTWPIDPAKIITTPDMDLSYALAGTLVEWGKNKHHVAGLTDKWEITGEYTYRFTIRKNLKWSDGSPITAQEIKKSLERGIKSHPIDLRGLAVLLSGISCPTPDAIDFNLKVKAERSGLLGKLTEPNYGILKINPDNSINFLKSSGPFWAAQHSKEEIILKRNEQWPDFSPEMAESIIVKQSPKVGLNSQSVLLEDKWPNLVQTSSLISQDLMQKYESNGFQMWKRPTDRIFLFQLSKKLHNQDGLNLFLFFEQKIKRENIVKDFLGYQLAEQIFPQGYQLHVADYKPNHNLKVQLPTQFINRPLEILISPERVSGPLKENIKKAVTIAVGIEPKFISAPLQEIPKHYNTGDYDFYAGTVGLADPDPEGAMSFYFENEFNIIPSIGENFVQRLDQVRKEPDQQKRLQMMRSMLKDGVAGGYVFPLFNMSTVGIARADVDLSQVSLTDESVTLSKIRFHKRGQ